MKPVVSYSKAWVRSQSRMTATSNQQSYKAAGFCGRLVLDALRPVLMSHSLSHFSLAECVTKFLGATKEDWTHRVEQQLLLGEGGGDGEQQGRSARRKVERQGSGGGGSGGGGGGGG